MPESCVSLTMAFEANIVWWKGGSKYWLQAGCFIEFFTQLSENSRTFLLKDLGLPLLNLISCDLFFYCISKNKLEYKKFNYLHIVEKRDGGLDAGKFYDRPKQTLMLLF